MLFAPVLTCQALGNRWLTGLLISMCSLWSGVAVVHAHELRPAIATIQFQDAGEFELTISLNLEAAMAGIGPHHADTSHSQNAGDYDRLRRLSPSALAAEFDTYASQFLAGIWLAFDSDRARLAAQSA